MVKRNTDEVHVGKRSKVPPTVTNSVKEEVAAASTWRTHPSAVQTAERPTCALSNTQPSPRSKNVLTNLLVQDPRRGTSLAAPGDSSSHPSRRPRRLHSPVNRQLWVLKLRRENIDGRVEYPPELGESCPHIHDSRNGLGKHNIEDVIELNRAEGQKWGDVKEMGELEG
jgi:hypothetical protein